MVEDNQHRDKPAERGSDVARLVMYPENCVVISKNEVIEYLKTLEGLKRRLQALVK